RPSGQELGERRPQVSGAGAPDALRRDRAPLDLRRGLAAGGQGAARGGHRVSPAAGPPRRAELGRMSPGALGSWQFWALASAAFAALTAIFAKVGVENVNS